MQITELITQLSFLAASDTGKPQALPILRSAFALVPHQDDDKTFLAGYVVRRILQSQELAALDESALLRLSDWASEEMIAFMASAAEDASHPRRSAITKGVVDAGLGLDVLVIMRDCLAIERLCNTEQEFIFRLIYFAGREADDLAALHKMDATKVIEGCLAVEELLNAEFNAENPTWELSMLHKAGIRPPGATTRILDGVRAGNMRMWDAIANPAFLQNLGKNVTETSLLSELVLRAGGKKDLKFIPENTERLRGLVWMILRNLERSRGRVDGRNVPIEQEDAEGRSIDLLSEQEHEDWFLANMIASRQEGVVEGVRRVCAMLEEDHPEWIRTFELCFLSDPKRMIPEIARLLKVDIATVGRRKRSIQEYFRKHLESEGVELSHYAQFSPKQRLENLYQLIEKSLRNDYAIPDSSRDDMIKVIADSKTQDPVRFDLLNERYLNPKLGEGRKELAAKRGIKTAEMEEELRNLRSWLTQRTAERAQQRLSLQPK